MGLILFGRMSPQCWHTCAGVSAGWQRLSAGQPTNHQLLRLEWNDVHDAYDLISLILRKILNNWRVSSSPGIKQLRKTTVSAFWLLFELSISNCIRRTPTHVHAKQKNCVGNGHNLAKNVELFIWPTDTSRYDDDDGTWIDGTAIDVLRLFWPWFPHPHGARSTHTKLLPNDALHTWHAWRANWFITMNTHRQRTNAATTNKKATIFKVDKFISHMNGRARVTTNWLKMNRLSHTFCVLA